MSVFLESGITFDFGETDAHQHDAANSEFPGVDFIIAETDRDVWLEVKNWNRAEIQPERREDVRQDFLTKLQSKAFALDALGGKFIGTVAFLCLTGNPPTRPIYYVALLELPEDMEPALKVRANDWLRGLVKRDQIWRIAVDAAIMNLAEWNRQFPEYPAAAQP